MSYPELVPAPRSARTVRNALALLEYFVKEPSAVLPSDLSEDVRVYVEELRDEPLSYRNTIIDEAQQIRGATEIYVTRPKVG